MECFLPCEHFLVKAQATQTLFWVHWTACGESGPLPQVVLFDRSVWSDRNLLFHVKKFSFPFLLCQASNQTFSQNRMDHLNLFGDFGRFPINQKVWFAFLAENGTAFSKIFKKRTTLRGIPCPESVSENCLLVTIPPCLILYSAHIQEKT